jgi:hypothetical protein
MAEKDPNFKGKFGKALEVLADILKKSRLTHTPTKVAMENLRKRMKSELVGFYIPERNYRHTWKHFVGKFEIRQGVKTGIPNDTLPSKRFIGIGYRDKGTARNLALNGEPTWQEYCRMRLWENLT